MEECSCLVYNHTKNLGKKSEIAFVLLHCIHPLIDSTSVAGHMLTVLIHKMRLYALKIGCLLNLLELQHFTNCIYILKIRSQIVDKMSLTASKVSRN